MSELKTDFQNDVLDAEVNPYRKYQIINNSDGTVSFVDVTTYAQTGDEFGATEINATNTAINDLNSKLNAKSNSTLTVKLPLSSQYNNDVRKSGNMCSIVYGGINTTAQPVNQDTIIATVPDSYKPLNGQYGIVVWSSTYNSSTKSVSACAIYPDGTIHLLIGSGTVNVGYMIVILNYGI